MTLSAQDLAELTSALADRLYLQVANWNLYLGDAGLAATLASECAARAAAGSGGAAAALLLGPGPTPLGS